MVSYQVILLLQTSYCKSTFNFKIISGSKYGPFVRKWGAHSEVADLGQAFIAINPKAFADGFEERMSDLMSYLRNMEPVSNVISIFFKFL